MHKHTPSLDYTKTTEFSGVYYYLMAGIMILVAVFLFIPQTSMGT